MNEVVDAWRGQFGDEYTSRNSVTPERLHDRVLMWRRILSCFADERPGSAVELGCNIGMNLRAIKQVSDMALYGVEPNDRARELIVKDDVLPRDRILEGHGAAMPLDSNAVELAFTSGVLIHVDPKQLGAVADELHRVTSKYIVLAEYFSVEPEERLYRGQSGLLFKRDFGGFFLDRFPDLALVDYGFLWRRATGLDDLTWWALRKK
jgi:pseudaminic acid biosynthesis-associated methylase